MKGYLAFETLEGVVGETSLRIEAEVLESRINSINDDEAPSITLPDGTILDFPQDRNLGFDRDSLSGGVKRMIGHTAGVLSFKESNRMDLRKPMK